MSSKKIIRRNTSWKSRKEKPKNRGINPQKKKSSKKKLQNRGKKKKEEE